MERMIFPAILLATAVVVGYSDDVARLASVQPPRMTVTGVSPTMHGDQQFLSLTIEVFNPNEASIIYTGYTTDSFDPPLAEGVMSPLYQIETLRDGEWTAFPIGWCGTGMGDVELKPNSKSTFGVEVPDDGWDAVRIEFGHTPDWSLDVPSTMTKWSIQLSRDALRPRHEPRAGGYPRKNSASFLIPASSVSSPVANDSRT